MNRNDFILPVSMIKVQEKKLLNEDRLIKMLETNSFKEILRILNDTDYSYSIATTMQDDEYEKIINGELERVFKFTREISKNNQEIVDLAALKYEYQNLKLLLKDKGNVLDVYNISTGIIDKEELMNNFNEVKKYNASVAVQNLDRDTQLVSAKSLMKIVALGVVKGHRLRFVASGEEAQQAIDGIGAVIESGLGEGRG